MAKPSSWNEPPSSWDEPSYLLTLQDTSSSHCPNEVGFKFGVLVCTCARPCLLECNALCLHMMLKHLMLAHAILEGFLHDARAQCRHAECHYGTLGRGHPSHVHRGCWGEDLPITRRLGLPEGGLSRSSSVGSCSPLSRGWAPTGGRDWVVHSKVGACPHRRATSHLRRLPEPEVSHPFICS